MPYFLLVTCSVCLFFTSIFGAQAQSNAHTHPTKTSNQIQGLPKQSQYVCPMHNHITRDHQGTCPICGMTLVPAKQPVNSPDNTAVIHVSGDMQQALAIKVQTADYNTLNRAVTTVGQVEFDEQQISHIHARVRGWIETLAIKSVGESISQGQLLYQIYSPELINAQDDYLLALESATQGERYQSILAKAQLRLELLGFTREQIQALKQHRETQYLVSFYAKHDSVVKNLYVREGMYIEPQTEILALADLNKIWIITDVFENEQSWLNLGQSATVSVPALQLKDLKAQVDYIYPELDPITRSLKVRLVLTHSDTILRPNTLVEVKLLAKPKTQVLTVPQQALIQTGQDNRLIIKTNDTSFKAVEVVVGARSQEQVEIVSGLQQGDQVVVSGQFLLDSEASLSGGLLRLSSEHNHE